MKKLQILQKIQYGNFDKNFFEENKKAIDAENINMLSTACLGSVVILGIVFFMSLCMPALANARFMYVLALVYHIVLLLLYYKVIKNKPQFARPFFYLWALSAITIALAGNYHLMQLSAPTVFLILLVTVPVLVLDKPCRPVCLIMLGTLAVFILQLVLAYNAGEFTPQQQVNLIDAIIVCSTGIIFSYFISNARLKSLHRMLRYQQKSKTDRLTRLTNKATTEAMCKQYLNENRTGNSVFMMIDIDNFKCINDGQGHSQGDMVLQEVGQVLKDNFRASDIMGRVGGDEFVVLAKNVNIPQQAEVKAYSICEKVAQIALIHSDKKITCSIGATMILPQENEYMDVFERADKALYKAKGNGKNCVAVVN